MKEVKEVKPVKPVKVFPKRKLEIWIDTYTPYKCGWWKGTFLDPYIVDLKVLTVLLLMFGVPASTFLVIDTEFMTDVLKDVQKGAGGG